MPRMLLILSLWAALAWCGQWAAAAPPGPSDLKLSIETSRKAITDMERLLHDYDVEMRRTVDNEPASVRRREEIRIIKRYYQQEIEAHKAKIVEEYKRLQEYRARGLQ